MTQAERDEAARLMGYVETNDTHPELKGKRWLMPNGRYQLKMAWKPDVDANQAFMLRDRCVELGLGAEYTVNLLKQVKGFHVSSDDACQLIAYATAEQITNAAMKTLKENQ